MDRPVSDELRSLLSRKEMRGATAPTVKPHAMSWANDLLDREESMDANHSPSDGEGCRRNTNSNARVRIVRTRPFLAVITGGKSAH